MRRLVAALLMAMAAFGAATPVWAQPATRGPAVVLDQDEAEIGDRLVMTISGFQARVVDITVCGNEARRGSVDCDNRGTRARETNDDGAPTPAHVIVTAPPVACPCIVRVTSRDNLELAVAPVTIIGHPVADLQDSGPSQIPLSVGISAERMSVGAGSGLRQSLGGPATYEVAVSVRNASTFRIDNVAVASTYDRGDSDVRTIEIPDPGPLEPGESWEQLVEVEVPALTFGEVEWSATASGQGPSVTATDTTTSRPWLLIVLCIVLAIDLVILLVRLVNRLRGRLGDDGDDPYHNPFIDDTDDFDMDAYVAAAIAAEQRESHPVG